MRRRRSHDDVMAENHDLRLQIERMMFEMSAMQSIIDANRAGGTRRAPSVIVAPRVRVNDDADTHISSVSEQRTIDWVQGSNDALRHSLTQTRVQEHNEKPWTEIDAEARRRGQPDRHDDVVVAPGRPATSTRAATASVRSGSHVDRRVAEPVTASEHRPALDEDRRVTVTSGVGYASAGHRDVKPRPFSGDAHVEPYLAQFKMIAKLAGSPRDEWGFRLITVLEGKARSVLAGGRLSEQPSFEEVATLLRARFASESSPELWIQTLEGRRRGDKETIAELSHNILDMVGKAYPDTDVAMRQRFAVTYFAGALKDDGQRLHVRTQAPRTLDDATRAALAYENAKRIEEKRAGNPRRVRAVAEEPGDAKKAKGGRDKTSDSRGRGAKRGHGRGRGQNEARGQSEVVAVVHRQDACEDEREDPGELDEAVRQVGHAAGHQGQQSGRGRGGPPQSSRQPQMGYDAGQEGAEPVQQGCWNCGSLEHYRRECPEPRSHQPWRQGNGRGRGSTEQAPGPRDAGC